MVKNFYITTPIFYPNANPHMGHAYTTLSCDVLARYHRLAGHDTYFLTGTDEHTEKVIQAAKEHNQDPEKYLEDVVARFKNLYKDLNISYDQFVRTSDQTVHWPGAIEMWNRLVASGDIYKGEYSGLYCVGCEAFLTEKELVDGMCPNHNKVPERVTEENYFFRLSKYALKLEQIISSDTIRIFPAARKNEALSFIKGGLDDVSFSRPKEKMSWGIPVPGDSSQTMYIWVDALSNYITALGFGRDNANIRFWPGMHVIGKDILRFHAIYWPAMLLSAKIPLPHTIFVHGLITSGGRKMSKTLGNIVDPFTVMNEYGTDALRYYLARQVHPFEDSDFTMEKFKEAYNANLVNGLGNFVARV
ncbi:MAG: methionine--tRNA ligase, partial [Patescibacteria group bacterium]